MKRFITSLLQPLLHRAGTRCGRAGGMSGRGTTKAAAAAIEEAITDKSKVLVPNFPTNPTGGTMTCGEPRFIANLAVKHNLIVITDEIYAELTFEGEHVSIASRLHMERTIFLHGFSAYAMTGFRISFACGPETLVGAMTRIHQYSSCASIVSQEAALEALRNGEEPMRNVRRTGNAATSWSKP